MPDKTNFPPVTIICLSTRKFNVAFNSIFTPDDDVGQQRRPQLSIKSEPHANFEGQER
jgi:hypothetical protein